MEFDLSEALIGIIFIFTLIQPYLVGDWLIIQEINKGRQGRGEVKCVKSLWDTSIEFCIVDVNYNFSQSGRKAKTYKLIVLFSLDILRCCDSKIRETKTICINPV